MSSSTKPPSHAPTNSAPEWRRDPVTGHSFLLAAGRSARPHDFPSLPDTPPILAECPFCAGNESQTTPTIASFPSSNPAITETTDWHVRVVGNLYPIFQDPAVAATGGEFPSVGVETRGDGTIMDNPAGSQRFDLASCRSPAWGWHEVIIEAREHVRQMTELSVGHVEQIFSAYRARLAAHRKSPGCRAAMIFKNSGRDAGMSREHLHSQLVALSATPPLIALELAGAESFRAAHAQCVFCYLADQARECQPARVIAETATLVAYCPFASRTAFEVWVQPREHAACFDVTSDKCLAELAQLVPDILRRLQCHLGSFAYNYVLHTLPFDTRREDHYHWHIEIIPRTSRLAGLEWGSGILVNTMAPEEAAARLRGVEFADQVELTSGEEKTSEKN